MSAILVLGRHIPRIIGKIVIAIAVAACAVLLLPHMAGAQGFKGAQPYFLDGGKIISFSGDTITVTESSTPVEVYNYNSNGTKGSLVGQLIGISGIWVVTPQGTTVAGVSSVSGDGTLSGTSKGNPVTTSWTAETNPAGYEGASGYTASGKGNWLELVDASTISYFGKGVGTPYTSGVFTFPGVTSFSGLDIGIDYLIGTAKGVTITGRMFFDAPEPSTTATFSIVGIALAGLMFAARRRARLSA